MPDNEAHCGFSLAMTGKRYEDLHRWMDEPRKTLGVKHREERHSLKELPEAKERWGEEGGEQYLFHIILDFQKTAETYKDLFEAVKQEKNKENKRNNQLRQNNIDLTKSLTDLRKSHTDLRKQLNELLVRLYSPPRAM